MRPSVRLGSFAGIPLAAHWSALVMPVLVAYALGSVMLPQTVKGESQAAYWIAAVLVAVIFLASLVAHELAHAVVARRQGIPVQGITLWMLGGLTSLTDEPRTPQADLKVALAGPATSVGCAVVAGAAAVVTEVAGGARLAVAGLTWLAVVNVTLAVFNLIPGAPLDGGRVLRAILWRRTGDRRAAEQSAARAGRVTGGVLVALGALELITTNDLVGALWLAAIGWFISTVARAEGDVSQTQDALRELSVGDATDRNVPVLRSYQSCAVAARRAVETNADYGIVETFEGTFVGIVDIAQLVKAARDDGAAPCGEHARRVPPTAFAQLDARLQAALLANGQRVPLVSMDGEAIAGLVTTESLTHALRRRLLETPYVDTPPTGALAG